MIGMSNSEAWAAAFSGVMAGVFLLLFLIYLMYEYGVGVLLWFLGSVALVTGAVWFVHGLLV